MTERYNMPIKRRSAHSRKSKGQARNSVRLELALQLNIAEKGLELVQSLYRFVITFGRPQDIFHTALCCPQEGQDVMDKMGRVCMKSHGKRIDRRP